MSVGTLFLSLDGRIGRLQWWIATIVIEAITMLLIWLAGVPLSTDPSTFGLRLTEFIIQLLSIYPSFAISVKRLHDRDHPAATVYPLFAAFIVMLIGNLFGYFSTSSQMTLVEMIVIIIIIAIMLGYLVELGFRRGKEGPNRYGSEPADQTVSSIRPR